MKRAPTFTLLVALVVAGCGEDEFRVERLSPKLGVLRGGERVTVEGRGFDRQQGIAVYFGSVRADHVAIAGPDELWVNTPVAERSGPVDVRVIGSDGTEFLISDGFEYVARNEMAECVNISKALNGEPVAERRSLRER